MIIGLARKHLHFVGIGGYGMSGLAQVLHQRGIRVSGCDARPNPRTTRLALMGVPVFEGHDPSHLDGVDVLVYSTDVPETNPELIAAGGCGVELLHRAEVLSWFLNAGHGIAVTGTHGKTTTTAILGLALRRAGLDPTVLVGGDVQELGGTAVAGGGAWVVAEACESDGTFLKYRPRISVVTNIEPEHLDHYGGSVETLVDAFQDYIDNTDSSGVVILGADDPRLRTMRPRTGVRVRTFGGRPDADIRATDIDTAPKGTTWTVVVDGETRRRLSSRLLGHHNVLNATAAAAACIEAGVDLEHLDHALDDFRGVDRRFQVITTAGDVTVVSDYAHHPTEIRATISAARQVGPRRLIAVFQPQRYKRTKSLWDGFASAFGEADQVVLTEIYAPVGEEPIVGVSGRALADQISARSGRPTTFLPTPEEVQSHLLDVSSPGDMVLVMGAGDIYRVAHQLGEELEKQRAM